MALGKVLDEQGRKNGWIAEKLGVSPATVTLWRQGKREIPERRVHELAELLGVPEDAIREVAPLSPYGQQPASSSGVGF